MRVFVSLSLPSERRQALEAFLCRLRDARALKGRPVRPTNFHLTLAFIGEVEPAEAKRIAQALSRLEAVPLTFAFSQVGTFRSGILWAGLEEKAELGAFAQRVRTLLEEEGVAYDSRPFRAHVTLARAWRGSVPVQFRDLHALNGSGLLPEVQAKAVLMESARLDDGVGLEYRPVVP